MPDTDIDGLDDDAEVSGPTDLLVADTDADGLDDGVEVDVGTSPTRPDSDDGGLSDGREHELGTDPLDPDTGGDGVSDDRDEYPTGETPTATPTRTAIPNETTADAAGSGPGVVAGSGPGFRPPGTVVAMAIVTLSVVATRFTRRA